MVRSLIIAILALVIPAAAGAQTNGSKSSGRDYPSRPVRLIIPAAPGGNPDVLGRVLGQKLSERFGKPFVIEDVPGAGGVAAAEMVAKAPADGYVLMLGDSGSMAIAVSLYRKLAYNPLRDFTPITALVAVPTVLIVPPSLPATNLAEFVALAKAKPGVLTFGSAGKGSIHQLTMVIFAARAGIDLLHVPYKGGTALVQAALAGEIQAGWSGIPNVLQPIHSGALRVLCISVEHRSSSLPDVPTAAELGYPGFDVATVIGLQGPAGLPGPVVTRLQHEVAAVLRAPDVAQRMAFLGMELRENGTDDYARFMRADIDRYAEAVKAAGGPSD